MGMAMEQFKDKLSYLSAKKILILGLGVENLELLKFLSNFDFDITVVDEKREADFGGFEENLKKLPVKFIFGVKLNEINDHYDIIFRTPGVSPLHPFLVKAKDQGSIITSQTQLFLDLVPTKNIIGVTGTKGKGTTTTLIGEILKNTGKHVFIGGNIGLPPISFLNQVTEESFVVLELSSFQLFDLVYPFHVAVVLMITVEHLDYHADEREYVESKQNLIKNQTAADFAVINTDYPNSARQISEAQAQVYQVSTKGRVEQGSFVLDGWVCFGDEKIVDLSKVKLPGRHNWENIAAATCVSKILKIDNQTIQEVVSSFKGLPHRIEEVAIIDGVTFYDDSFSTVPETAIAAIHAFDKPLTVILGGSSKSSDFNQLAKVILSKKNIVNLLLIGQEGPRIKEAILKLGHFDGILVENGLDNMKAIVQKAKLVTPVGGIVLLSPACASFDMFVNYKDRGDQFKREVKKLIQKRK